MLLYPLSRPTCILFVDSQKGKQKRRLAWKNPNFCLHKLISFVFEKTISARSDVFFFFLTKREERKMRTGTRNGKWETGNGKRETGNWGRENENKTFLNPLSPDYQKPHCPFSILLPYFIMFSVSTWSFLIPRSWLSFPCIRHPASSTLDNMRQTTKGAT